MSRLAIPVGTADHAQGPATAAVTLVEYGDYECPYCGQMYPLIKAVQREMGGRLRFVFRNFPLTEIHPHALAAARFAEAAAEAGRFWEAHDLLFERQQALGVRDLLADAGLLGIDEPLVRQAFDGRFDGRIDADFDGGVRSGVNGTPTLFIDGLRYDGPRDLRGLLAAGPVD